MVSINKTRSSTLDGGWGWVVVFASFVTHTLMAALYFAYGVLTQTWVEEFNSTAAVAALVGSTASGFASMSAPLASFLINKCGCRTAHMIGGILVTVGVFGSSFATNLPQLFVFYGVFGGIGLGLGYVPSVIILSQYFKHRRALAIGIASSGIGVGSFIFPLILEYLQNTYSWRGAMLILSAIIANYCVSAMVMLPIAPVVKDVTKYTPALSVEELKSVNELEISSDQKYEISEKEPNNNESKRKSSFQIFRNLVRHPWMRRQSSITCESNGNEKLRSTLNGREDIVIEESHESLCSKESEKLNESSLPSKTPSVTSSIRLQTQDTFLSQSRKLFSSPLFYVMIVNNVTMFIGMMLVFSLTPIRATSDLGFSTDEGALLVSVVGLSNLIGRFSWGALLNLFPQYRPIVLFIALRALASALTLLSPLTVTFTLQIIYCGAVGLMFGSWSLYPLVVADMFGDNTLNVAFGYLEVFDGIGCLIGPTFGGLIYDVTKSYHLSFVLAGSTLAFGTVILAIGCRCFHFRKNT